MYIRYMGPTLIYPIISLPFSQVGNFQIAGHTRLFEMYVRDILGAGDMSVWFGKH
jgi:hypothetical protein